MYIYVSLQLMYKFWYSSPRDYVRTSMDKIIFIFACGCIMQMYMPDLLHGYI